jgi:DNA-binding IclR family transcriptional regulator
VKRPSTAKNISVIPARMQAQSASVGVISKVLSILEALQTSSGGLSLKAICEDTGINKSTAHRFLRHLERESYLLRTESGKYLIGPRLAQMSGCATRSATLQTVARPVLAQLWRSTQETVNLAVLDQGTVLYVDVMVSQHDFRLVSRVGTRRPLHAAGLGKVLSVFRPAVECERLLSGIVFQRETPKTIGNVVQLRAELEKVRRQGYAVDDEEALLGCRCVAAPILNNAGTAIGALSVAGPVTRMTMPHIAGLAKQVKAAAHAVSLGMGFSPRKRSPGEPLRSRVASA